ncbi:hypothetical protein SLEP1_g43750 [Rubroshorea leprosula]|uniref:Uncharacterized protein n=1 Tax=Rubroshorea leprosula TaxID=152421 RepID=A0AAV5LEE3_9ROSI|nr:hypothetical protein SLEP1_g43750 [Rubroshorea leprosula]
MVHETTRGVAAARRWCGEEYRRLKDRRMAWQGNTVQSEIAECRVELVHSIGSTDQLKTNEVDEDDRRKRKSAVTEEKIGGRSTKEKIGGQSMDEKINGRSTKEKIGGRSTEEKIDERSMDKKMIKISTRPVVAGHTSSAGVMGVTGFNGPFT